LTECKASSQYFW